MRLYPALPASILVIASKLVSCSGQGMTSLINAIVRENQRHAIFLGAFGKGLKHFKISKTAITLYDTTSPSDFGAHQEKAHVIVLQMENIKLNITLTSMAASLIMHRFHISTGVYDQRHKIFFMAKSKYQEDMILSEEPLGHHGRAAIYRELSHHILETRINPFLNNVIFRNMYSLGHFDRPDISLLTPIPMTGYNLKYMGLPDNTAYIVNLAESPLSPRHVFMDHTGVACEFWKAAAQAYNMTIEFLNPPDMQYLAFGENGFEYLNTALIVQICYRVGGIVGDLMNRETDVAYMILNTVGSQFNNSRFNNKS